MSNFIILLRYAKPLEAIDALMDEHVTWVRGQYEAGQVLAWGRMVPREGGVIIARAASRDAVEALASAAPFVRGGAALAEVIEWAGFAGPELPGLNS